MLPFSVNRPEKTSDYSICMFDLLVCCHIVQEVLYLYIKLLNWSTKLPIWGDRSLDRFVFLPNDRGADGHAHSVDSLMSLHAVDLPTDQLHFPLQHCENPDDQTARIHHFGDHTVQVHSPPTPQRASGVRIDEVSLHAVVQCSNTSAAESFCPAHCTRLRRKAVKATLVLLPLLGITYMLFFVNPGEDEISQSVFIYFNSFLESFQVNSVCACMHVWLIKHNQVDADCHSPSHRASLCQCFTAS